MSSLPDRHLAWWMRATSWAAAMGIRSWMRTLDYQACWEDPAMDPIYPSDQPRIYVFWHEFILVPLYLRGHCDLTMLLSKHRDADILAAMAAHLGFECVRGSTYHGATAALRELTRQGRNRHLTITPDGPRGPRRQLAPGPIYLASRLQLPIVALGFGIHRPWRANSWDRFAVPRPGTRVRAMISSPIHIPKEIPRDQIEPHRVRVEQQLNALCDEAQAWADTRSGRPQSLVARRQARLPAGSVPPLPPKNASQAA
jgi:lysophospholipid acyltransferase (LPLAT)-like uncharacterized protein